MVVSGTVPGSRRGRDIRMYDHRVTGTSGYMPLIVYIPLNYFMWLVHGICTDYGRIEANEVDYRFTKNMAQRESDCTTLCVRDTICTL